MRLVQHKTEARWFYRFLSIVYDDLVNPLFWTERMRDEALTLARLDKRDLKVIDVGSGTGFTTEGIAHLVDAANISCVDQSPHQMARARRKPSLQECTFQLGDAEALPVASDSFERYVSAGSIEYWPDPARALREAFRVLKPGGYAVIIGPLLPQNAIARWAAEAWMLFPTEKQYKDWMRAAGFTGLTRGYVRPSWVMNEPYGIVLAGMKPRTATSTTLAPSAPHETGREPLSVRGVARVVVGSAAGGLFIPMALAGRLRASVLRALGEPGIPEPDPLTTAQRSLFWGLAIAFGLGLVRKWRS